MEAQIAQLQLDLARARQESAQHLEEKESAQRALAKKEKDLKLVAANTIENIYTERNASGEVQAKAPPPLDLKNTVKPSLGGHKRKGHTLAPVKIHNMKNEGSISMWFEPVLDIVTPIRDDEDGSLLPSKLGGQLGGQPTDSLEYNNEVDIQQFVRDLVGDAITALGLGGVLKDHVEVALYGIIPDIIVVRVRGRVVFFVEVKCPDVSGTRKDKTTVFTSEYVAGQVHSYLLAMLQHGNERPTGAIMTYEKMCLVSLRDTKEDAERKTLIEEASKKLKIPWRKNVDLESEPRNESCDPYSSPSRTQKELKALVQPYVAKTVPKKKKFQNIGMEQDLDSTVSYSRIYEKAEIFPALLQGLQLAFDDSIKMQIDAHLPVARHDEPLGGRLFLKGDGTTTKFVVTAAALKANANEFPAKSSRLFYLLAQLGTGKVGRTYLACNSEGNLCAVKMYIPKRSVAANAADREAEWKDRYKEEEIKRDEELKRWDTLCESNPAFGVKLCGNPCVVMPYGIEIPSDERTEDLVRNKIKDLLTEFAKEGFSYGELRWRHILRDYNKKLFLVDLESLTNAVKSPSKEWVASVVKKQVNELLKKLATATPSPADENATARVEVAPATRRKRKRN